MRQRLTCRLIHTTSKRLASASSRIRPLPKSNGSDLRCSLARGIRVGYRAESNVARGERSEPRGPGSARAASAGTYILYASLIAAMAPGTNLGAATPIQIGMPSPSAPQPQADKDKDKKADDHLDTLGRKQVHDAAAYIRGLAQLRGRNADWGERAVREAVSLSADEALAQHVTDLSARDVTELIAKVDGRKVTTSAGERTLATSGAEVITLAPDWKARFLAIITEPSVALILMMLGVYGLLFEFTNPGFVLPGVIGGIALLIGLFALNMPPVNYAGLALVMLGLSFMLA